VVKHLKFKSQSKKKVIGGEDRIAVPGQPRQKDNETPHLNKQARCVLVHICNPSHVGGIGRRISV
jgi:hypothetical protein